MTALLAASRAMRLPGATRRPRGSWPVALSALLHLGLLLLIIVAAQHERRIPEAVPPAPVAMVFEGGGKTSPSLANNAPKVPNEPGSPPSIETAPLTPAPVQQPAPTPPTTAPLAEAPPTPEAAPVAPQTVPPTETPPKPQPTPVTPAEPPPPKQAAPAPAPTPAPQVAATEPPAQPAPPPPPVPAEQAPAVPVQAEHAPGSQNIPPPPPAPMQEAAARPPPVQLVPLRPSPPQHVAPSFPAPMDFSLGPQAVTAPAAPLAAPPRPRTSHSTIDLSFSTSLAGGDITQLHNRGKGDDVGADWLNEVQAWWIRHRFYPREAADQLQQGDVRLRLVVAQSGRVRKIDVEQGSGSPWLDLGALAVFRDADLPPLPGDVEDPTVTVDFTIHYEIIR